MSEILKNYDYILALDPSGSFNEGKGTTGWCIINKKNLVVECGYISALDFNTRQDYWKAHELLLIQKIKKYKNIVVVLEDYLLYASKAKQQINSRLETPQLLGILKYILDNSKVPYVIQTAAEVKKRWSDQILLWKEILIKVNKKIMVVSNKNCLLETNKHMRDALRHAIHYNTFKNKELKNASRSRR